MDGATASLIGVGIGGALSGVTAIVTARVNARASEQRFAREAQASERQFAREVEEKKLESLQSVLDEAGLALETVHWALREAIAVRRETLSSILPEDAVHKDWSQACARIDAAQAEVSREGTRLAIRLGTPTSDNKSPCVAAYDSLQERYRKLVREVQSSGGESPLARAELALDALGADKSYLNQAKDLLKPKTL